MADTAERVEPAEVETTYDAFISYSHAADGLLAPRLQSALQRFAKPWWQRRAIRVFRDESSLSANPHLWSSITEALDQSAWFVLLLSSEAAQSEWVNQEIDYWRVHKDPSRILPVVTDGDFDWTGTGTAFAPALAGAFTEEPRWVDLRWARADEQLDLNNARFRNATADIASTVRAIPKDDLESEEVRQHRRTRRTAWLAGSSLVLLTIAALVASLFSIQQRSEARQQRDDAIAARAEADVARADAEQSAIVARSEALAASATAVREEDAELSLLLGIEAITRDSNPRAISAVQEALQSHRAVFRVQWDPSRTRFGVLGGAMSLDGSLLAVGGLAGELEIWSVHDAEEPLWTLQVPGPGVFIDGPAFSTDGSTLYVSVTWHSDLAGSEARPVDQRFGIFTFDARTGNELAYVEPPECVYFESFIPTPHIDPTREVHAIRRQPSDHVSGCDSNTIEIGRLDLKTGAFEPLATTRDRITGNFPTVSADGRRVAVGSSGPGRVIDLRTGEELLSFDGGVSTLTQDGTRVLIGKSPLELWNLETGEKIREYQGNFAHASFSPDERLVIAGSFDGSTYIFDAETGSELYRIRGQGGRQVKAYISEDLGRVATFSADASASVWTIATPIQTHAQTYEFAADDRSEYWNAGVRVAGNVGIARIWHPLGGTAVLFDAASGEATNTYRAVSAAISNDGTTIALQPLLGNQTLEDVEVPGEYLLLGHVELRDSSSGELLATVEGLCEYFDGPGDPVPTEQCGVHPAPVPDFAWDLEFSPDGQMLAMGGALSHGVWVWDTASGEIVWFSGDLWSSPEPSLTTFPQVAWSPDGAHLAVISNQFDGVLVFDTGTWERIAAIPQKQLFSELVFSTDGSLLIGADWRSAVVLIDTETWTEEEPLFGTQQGGSLRDVDINDDGTLIATAGSDGLLRVWDVTSLTVVQEIDMKAGQLMNVEFISATELLVSPRTPDAAVVITLDPERLLEVARTRVTRSLSDEECRTYSIDPCPTLEEIQGG